MRQVGEERLRLRREEAGVWGLYFRRPVLAPASLRVEVVAGLRKGPSVPNLHQLNAVFNIVVK